jgi:hypothetical protein
MPLLGFKKRFAPAVESGKKRQTIRARRKDGLDPKPGQTLYLYTALRTTQARKLREATCTAVKAVTIDESGMLLLDGLAVIEPSDRNAFAIADGFGSWDELVDYWQTEHGRDLPWYGIVIYW